LLLLLTSNSRAQSDSTLTPILQKLSNDLSTLSLDNQNNTLAFPGETEQNFVAFDFTEKYESYNSVLFKIPISNADTFYRFINDLPLVEKQNLIVHYYGIEKDFRERLRKAGLPEEISFLIPALSGMNVRSVGDGKRAGLWQLTHFQAVLNRLDLNRLVDERFDLGRSTSAAIAEIVKMKELFGSDEKAILAFLTGPTIIRNAMAETPEDAGNYDIISLLPQSVSETIALWQAMSVFLSENKPGEMLTSVANDTVSIARKMHFQQVSSVLDISIPELQKINPQYLYSIIPGTGSVNYLYLPKGKKEEFQLLQNSVYQQYDSTLFEVMAQKIEYPPAPTRQYVGEKVKDLEIEGKTKIKYTLKSGDVLGFIAEDYNVQVEDLKYWNNISNERRIQAGQKLDIFVDDEDADYYRNLHPEPLTKSGQKNPAAAVSFPIPENAQKIEHIVKSGESPYVIAQKYKGVTPEAILYWNGISDARKIQIGQKLTIYVSR